MGSSVDERSEPQIHNQLWDVPVFKFHQDDFFRMVKYS